MWWNLDLIVSRQSIRSLVAPWFLNNICVSCTSSKYTPRRMCHFLLFPSQRIVATKSWSSRRSIPAFLWIFVSKARWKSAKPKELTIKIERSCRRLKWEDIFWPFRATFQKYEYGMTKRMCTHARGAPERYYNHSPDLAPKSRIGAFKYKMCSLFMQRKDRNHF